MGSVEFFLFQRVRRWSFVRALVGGSVARLLPEHPLPTLLISIASELRDMRKTSNVILPQTHPQTLTLAFLVRSGVYRASAVGFCRAQAGFQALRSPRILPRYPKKELQRRLSLSLSLSIYIYIYIYIYKERISIVVPFWGLGSLI